ncbi:2,3-diaminopropionate biosynthesis protein SbnB [Burkholderia sp. WAC0059]|uniref:2,3-diaminopropionate biosynthesis protein SbnB n=1 Tax=Burkholderia sp. WAC0059 TaxID=2066022 RepID=UPI000C7EA7A1|nr:2,3-diaminopropionate biosynthesis protein SbnB [Burkholderia sp. WAC0059]PLZ02451.1 2,3-diaminopropionate biosynthesis protein SbnB [Burkholderia sp. WAC0059]
MFDFKVIPGTAVKSVLAERAASAIADVQAAYLAHHDHLTVNPDSYFLRFPDAPRDRIIALPASIGGDIRVAGIKWIASFPQNVDRGLPRASAVLLLNDPATGYPFACLEGALISAARTAASAVLGAYWLNGRRRAASTIAFVGAGVIARNIVEMFVADGWEFGEALVHDTDATSAAALWAHAQSRFGTAKVVIADGLDAALAADLVVFATNASSPYVRPVHGFLPRQTILNISLRDLAPEAILSAFNLFDDVDHCLKADTSPHLAEKLCGDRHFVGGTLAGLIRGEIVRDETRPAVFSPFGMGILDLALGRRVYDEACARGLAVDVPGFFGETSRW